MKKMRWKGTLLVALIFSIIGIGLITIGLATGASLSDLNYGFFGNGKMVTVDKNFEETIENLDLELAAGNLIVKTGETFRVEGNVPENMYEIVVENGTLQIERKNSYWLNFLWPFHFENDDMKLTVYVPANFIADKLSIEVDAGKANISNLKANRAEIELNAGKLDIDTFEVKEKGTIKLNAGKMSLTNVVLCDTTIKMNAGKADIDGTFTGDTRVKVNAGSFSLATNLLESDYSYDIDSNAGSITINGEEYSHDKSSIGNNAANSFDLECNAGSLHVTTK